MYVDDGHFIVGFVLSGEGVMMRTFTIIVLAALLGSYGFSSFWQRVLEPYQVSSGDPVAGLVYKRWSIAVPPGGKIVGDPIVSPDSEAAILVVDSAVSEENVAYYSPGAGWVTLLPGEKRKVVSAALSDDGTHVAILSRSYSTDRSKLYFWREDGGLRALDQFTFSGAWKMKFYDGSAQLLFVPDSGQSSVQGPVKGEQSPAPIQKPVLLQLPYDEVDPLGLRFPAIEKRNATLIRLVEPSPEQEGGKSGYASKGKIEPVQMPEGGRKLFPLWDVDGDRAEDLLLFAPGGTAPRWRSYTLAGLDGKSKSAKALHGKTLSWRFGDPRGIPVPGDYDGDGRVDLATFTYGFPEAEQRFRINWQVSFSRGRPLDQVPTSPDLSLSYFWGIGKMVPAQADYDGDGKTDFAVYLPDQSTWAISYSRYGYHQAKAAMSIAGFGATFSCGLPGGIPVPADYTGDGRADPAVFLQPKEPGGKASWILCPLLADGSTREKEKLIEFGPPDSVPVPADYAGLGSAQLAVYQKPTRKWFVRVAQDRVYETKFADFGKPGEPVAHDFDGDGKADKALYFDSGIHRWVIRSSQFTEAGEKLLPNGVQAFAGYAHQLEGGLPPEAWVRKIQAE